MNDLFESCARSLSFGFFIMFVAVLVLPYAEASGDSFRYITEITPEISEHFYWLIICCGTLAFCAAIGAFISIVCCFIVYLVQRAWYLHKLRKPERVYTGDPL